MGHRWAVMGLGIGLPRDAELPSQTYEVNSESKQEDMWAFSPKGPCPDSSSLGLERVATS